jgi:hypothetical protein
VVESATLNTRAMAKEHFYIIDPNNKEHQQILLFVWLAHYFKGDYKEIWEEEEISQLLWRNFGLLGEEEILSFLEEVDIPNNYSPFIIKTEEHEKRLA